MCSGSKIKSLTEAAFLCVFLGGSSLEFRDSLHVQKEYAALCFIRPPAIVKLLVSLSVLDLCKSVDLREQSDKLK